MGKSLIIPGADFSSVAVPFIARVTIAANKTAVIYSGNNNAFLTIEAAAQEQTIDLTDNLAAGSPVLFDYTFAREYDVFKKVWVNVSNATTMQYALYCAIGVDSVLEDVKFFGKNTANIDCQSLLHGQNKITVADLSAFFGTIGASYLFRNCSRLESINMHNAKGLSAWDYLVSNCSALKTVDFSSLETLANIAVSIGSGPFVGCSSLETIVCPVLNSAGQSLLMKQIAAGANILTKYSGGSIVKVATNGTPGWTTTTGTPNPSTMTLWDSSVWDNPVAGTTYYVDASLNRLYTYNG